VASVPRRRQAIRRALMVLVLFLVFNYLVLPQLAGARRALDALSGVKPWLLVLALGLELGALVAYAAFMRVTLPPGLVARAPSRRDNDADGGVGGDPDGLESDAPSWRESKLGMFTLLRIQLSTKSVTNLVPGGTAAGSTLGYRLLVAAGVAGPDAAFTLATVGLASAVVLNVLLWLALLVSIPRGGFRPLYVTAAIVGVVVLSLFAALVVLLMKGREPAERITRNIARHIPKVEPDQAVALLHRIADQMQALADRPDLVRGGIGWATLNWLLDAGSLWVFLAAFGARVPLDSLLVSFGLANVLAAIPLTPGGLGVVEAVLTSTLVGFGVDGAVAAVGVVTYRLAAFWLPIPLGAFSYATLRYGPVPLAQTREQLKPLALEAFSDGGALTVD
jgi:uncharacterized protein (TIRG00374 family)